MIDLNTNKKYINNLKTNLLFGQDIKINNIGTLKSYTIKEILDMGFDKYNKWIGILCITKDDIDEMFDYELEERIPPFFFLYQNCILGESDIRENVIKAFEMVFNDSASVSSKGYFFLGHKDDNRHIDANNFDEIIEILRLLNCVQNNQNKARPKNDAQKKYFKKLKKVKEMRKDVEGEKEDDMPHIISAVCAKHSSYNLLNIQNLSLHQLINQYKRLCSIEEYSISFQSLMHGASSDDVKIKHWSEPME